MQSASFAQTLSGVAHAGNYGKIVRHGASGAIAFATDATAQRPCGVIAGGDHYTSTQCTVITAGPAPVLVGAAGLAVGFHYITCDAASKAKAAGAGDAVLGHVFVPVALTENALVEIIVNPSLGTPAE